MRKLLVLALITGMTQINYAQTLKRVEYHDGNQKLIGMVTSNTGKQLPGVLILPAWKGIDEESKEAAIALAKENYIAFIADIYGEGNIPADNSAAASIAGKYRQDYKAYQHRISLALDQLKKSGANPGRIAVIGYCFGGSGALEAARGNLPVKGIVSIHGGLGKDADRPNNALHAKMLIENPADDNSVTPEIMTRLIKEMNDGNADWQIITYAHSRHTFTDPRSPDYNDVMAKRAWQHTLLFLAEILK